MSTQFKMPVDWETSQPFRKLVVMLDNDEDKATACYTRLFRDLTYAAREGKPVGWIDRADEGLFAASLKLENVGLLAGSVGLLIAKDSGFFCPQYASLNAEVNRPRERQGALARAYDTRRGKALQRMAGEVMLIPREHFVHPDGTPMKPETMERVRMLIMCCDNALKRKVREHLDYAPALIQNALRICERYTDAQIDSVCRRTAMNQGHPYVQGLHTETLLAPVSGAEGTARFDQILEKLGMTEPA